MGLAERIEWVLENRKDRIRNASQWGLAAGLTRQHVHTILGRLKKDPGAQQEISTLHALAKVAGVFEPWFVSGRGEPDSQWDVPAFVMRYSSLESVLKAHATGARWSAPAVAAAKSMALDADSDPGEAWWTETLDRLDAAIKVSIPKIPARGADPLAGLDDRPVRTARKKK